MLPRKLISFGGGAASPCGPFLTLVLFILQMFVEAANGCTTLAAPTSYSMATTCATVLTIQASGTYIINGHVSGTQFRGITVTASNVFLTLGGGSITATSAGAAVVEFGGTSPKDFTVGTSVTSQSSSCFVYAVAASSLTISTASGSAMTCSHNVFLFQGSATTVTMIGGGTFQSGTALAYSAVRLTTSAADLTLSYNGATFGPVGTYQNFYIAPSNPSSTVTISLTSCTLQASQQNIYLTNLGNRFTVAGSSTTMTCNTAVSTGANIFVGSSSGSVSAGITTYSRIEFTGATWTVSSSAVALSEFFLGNVVFDNVNVGSISVAGTLTLTTSGMYSGANINVYGSCSVISIAFGSGTTVTSTGFSSAPTDYRNYGTSNVMLGYAVLSDIQTVTITSAAANTYSASNGMSVFAFGYTVVGVTIDFPAGGNFATTSTALRSVFFVSSTAATISGVTVTATSPTVGGVTGAIEYFFLSNAPAPTIPGGFTAITYPLNSFTIALPSATVNVASAVVSIMSSFNTFSLDATSASFNQVSVARSTHRYLFDFGNSLVTSGADYSMPSLSANVRLTSCSFSFASVLFSRYANVDGGALTISNPATHVIPSAPVTSTMEGLFSFYHTLSNVLVSISLASSRDIGVTTSGYSLMHFDSSIATRVSFLSGRILISSGAVVTFTGTTSNLRLYLSPSASGVSGTSSYAVSMTSGFMFDVGTSATIQSSGGNFEISVVSAAAFTAVGTGLITVAGAAAVNQVATTVTNMLATFGTTTAAIAVASPLAQDMSVTLLSCSLSLTGNSASLITNTGAGAVPFKIILFTTSTTVTLTSTVGAHNLVGVASTATTLQGSFIFNGGALGFAGSNTNNIINSPGPLQSYTIQLLTLSPAQISLTGSAITTQTSISSLTAEFQSITFVGTTSVVPFEFGTGTNLVTATSMYFSQSHVVAPLADYCISMYGATDLWMRFEGISSHLVTLKSSETQIMLSGAAVFTAVALTFSHTNFPSAMEDNVLYSGSCVTGSATTFTTSTTAHCVISMDGTNYMTATGNNFDIKSFIGTSELKGETHMTSAVSNVVITAVANTKFVFALGSGTITTSSASLPNVEILGSVSLIGNSVVLASTKMIAAVSNIGINGLLYDFSMDSASLSSTLTGTTVYPNVRLYSTTTIAPVAGGFTMLSSTLVVAPRESTTETSNVLIEQGITQSVGRVFTVSGSTFTGANFGIRCISAVGLPVTVTSAQVNAVLTSTSAAFATSFTRCGFFFFDTCTAGLASPLSFSGITITTTINPATSLVPTATLHQDMVLLRSSTTLLSSVLLASSTYDRAAATSVYSTLRFTFLELLDTAVGAPGSGSTITVSSIGASFTAYAMVSALRSYAPSSIRTAGFHSYNILIACMELRTLDSVVSISGSAFAHNILSGTYITFGGVYANLAKFGLELVGRLTTDAGRSPIFHLDNSVMRVGSIVYFDSLAAVGVSLTAIGACGTWNDARVTSGAFLSVVGRTGIVTTGLNPALCSTNYASCFDTRSKSKTVTFTQSSSMSHTYSPSQSISEQVSFSDTPSVSESSSSTVSEEISSTRSQSPSASSSVSFSTSLSASRSESTTETESLSSSATPELTASTSLTRSLSGSSSESPTEELTQSETQSASPTDTFSMSPSSSVTTTATLSLSPTLSMTPTYSISEDISSTKTPSTTASQTVTLSEEVSASPTFTLTESPTVSESPTSSTTSSFSGSQSFSEELTLSRSATDTPSETPSLTEEPSQTRTLSESESFSAIPSASDTLTITTTATTTLSFSGQRSSTPSRSPSDSITEDFSMTETLTRSSSETPTGTLSLSEVSSPSESRTPSQTASLTNESTFTETLSMTRSKTKTLTLSITEDVSHSPSTSVTSSDSETLTTEFSMTRTGSHTKSNSATAGTASRERSQSRTASGQGSITVTQSPTQQARSASNSASATSTDSDSPSESVSVTGSFTKPTPSAQASSTASTSHSLSHSPTPGRTFTPTPSDGTPTGDKSHSRSVPSPTDSMTHDPTYTGTDSLTISANTASREQSRSRAKSLTQTFTDIPTASSSPTHTTTPSATSERTRTKTATVSSSADPSGTKSAGSISAQASVTTTDSETVSLSASVTKSTSQQRSTTKTSSESQMVTVSDTQTETTDVSTSGSASVTDSETTSVSTTNSSSETVTISESSSFSTSIDPSATRSATASPTPSSSADASVSVTFSLTASSDKSLSRSRSGTAEISATPSDTSTVSVSQSSTASRTRRSVTTTLSWFQLPAGLTVTASESPSPTLSSSPSAQGRSASMSNQTSLTTTASVSVAKSQSGSRSTSVTVTVSDSVSGSFTNVASSSATQTHSLIESPTHTDNVTHSLSSAETMTVTRSMMSPTQSNSEWVSQTVTLKQTTSGSADMTLTATVTLTPPPTRTHTPTPTVPEPPIGALQGFFNSFLGQSRCDSSDSFFAINGPIILVILFLLLLRGVRFHLPCITVDTYARVPQWRSLLVQHAYLCLAVPCHVQCFFAHYLLFLLHANVLLMCVGAFALLFPASTGPQTAYSALFAVFAAQSIRPLYHWLYYRNGIRRLRLQKRLRNPEDDFVSLKDEEGRGPSRATDASDNDSDWATIEEDDNLSSAYNETESETESIVVEEEPEVIIEPELPQAPDREGTDELLNASFSWDEEDYQFTGGKAFKREASSTRESPQMMESIKDTTAMDRKSKKSSRQPPASAPTSEITIDVDSDFLVAFDEHDNDPMVFSGRDIGGDTGRKPIATEFTSAGVFRQDDESISVGSFDDFTAEVGGAGGNNKKRKGGDAKSSAPSDGAIDIKSLWSLGTAASGQNPTGGAPLPPPPRELFWDPRRAGSEKSYGAASPYAQDVISMGSLGVKDFSSTETAHNDVAAVTRRNTWTGADFSPASGQVGVEDDAEALANLSLSSMSVGSILSDLSSSYESGADEVEQSMRVKYSVRTYYFMATLVTGCSATAAMIVAYYLRLQLDRNVPTCGQYSTAIPLVFIIDFVLGQTGFVSLVYVLRYMRHDEGIRNSVMFSELHPMDDEVRIMGVERGRLYIRKLKESHRYKKELERMRREGVADRVERVVEEKRRLRPAPQHISVFMNDGDEGQTKELSGEYPHGSSTAAISNQNEKQLSDGSSDDYEGFDVTEFDGPAKPWTADDSFDFLASSKRFKSALEEQQ